MAKQNDVTLSALHRARLRRQRPAAEAADTTPDNGDEDVIVPSFLWEPAQEGSSGASSWKEDPLPARRRQPASAAARDDLPDAPFVPRERERQGREAAEEPPTPHGGRAYVFSARSGRETTVREDDEVPLRATPLSRRLSSPGAEAAFGPHDGETRDAARTRTGAADADDDLRVPPAEADAASLREPEAPLPDEEIALAVGEEDRREAEEASAARGKTPPQPSTAERGPAFRALPEETAFPEAWPDEDEDAPAEAALVSGEEDVRELRAALAARGIPLRGGARSDEGHEAAASVVPARNLSEAAGEAVPPEQADAPAQEDETAFPASSPADFAATPDAFLTAFGAEEGPAACADGTTETPHGNDAAPAPEGGGEEPPVPPRLPDPPDAGRNWLRRFFLILALLAAVGLGLLLPYSFWWVYADGDVAVERAVAAQAGGKFAIFGSGVSQDFVDYKLRLYAAVKPEIVAVGSSRVMQFRGSYFRRPFVNVGGTAGNLSVLRSTIDAMLRIHRPQVVIIGLDFWWFSANWQKDPFAPEPPTSGSYVYDLETLKAPWKWLLEGKIGWREFFAPLTGAFRDDRFGIMAQRSSDGFASDGSWHYTADLTGQQRPFDYQFGDTLKQVRYGIKAFAPAPALSEAHLDAFAEIYCRLKSRGIQTYVFIAPLSATVLDAMRERQAAYPHLFSLYTALMERGIDVMDFTDPRKFGSSDCEFVDGFHGGEVTYARILRDLVDRYHALVAYVDVERVNRVLKEWKGHATVYDERVTTLPEVDFMQLSCPKKQR